ncbi:ribosome maturation factor RimP [Tessaracoccus defluvii]|uniref:Ribosome maturation factor RimP n=1 Tax=Tessaracoccus defluvii TaxID=1285901 RepID=A0A7H0H7K8_9ACTN|nr:ribosome maturation factor RimP [Tessaracoccus defluvii]QNP56524.1 ribosome maturation factor RimP [Tessaracoccus defluvii]
MQETRLAELIEPILAGHGLELDHLEITPIGKRRILKVTVDGDGPSGRGPLVDDIAAAARSLSDALDESAATGDAPYTLEVSSRGVSRPLTAPKHYRRNTGRLIKVTAAEGGSVTGRIVTVTDDAVTLDVDGETREVELATVTKAVVQVEMNRADDEEEGN